mmetsp:Transcript_15498/g.31364  ORF Transcript_15498/g.31364 Transcript_15498/m.31364 type:complete len:84 (+) Transcript_15498:291-542(+)
MAKGRPTRNKKRQREDGYSYSSSEEQHCSSKKRQKKGKNKAISWTEEVRFTIDYSQKPALVLRVIDSEGILPVGTRSPQHHTL